MLNFKNDFCTKDLKDCIEYRYDVTDYMKELMGDFVESAYIQLGFVFKTDELYEQERDINKIYSEAVDIDKIFEDSKCFETTNNKTIFVFFENGKSIKFSTYDFAILGVIE